MWGEGEGRQAEVYARRIQLLGHAGLLEMWGRLQEGPLGDWPEGFALEFLVLRAFQLEGAEVTWPFQVWQDDVLLEQLDGALYFDGLSCLVETKDRARPLDYMTIARLKAQLLRRPRWAFGAVFSDSGFSRSALSMAQMLPPPDVLLWRGTEIERALRARRFREFMKQKLRYAVEHGFSDLDLTERKVV